MIGTTRRASIPAQQHSEPLTMDQRGGMNSANAAKGHLKS